MLVLVAKHVGKLPPRKDSCVLSPDTGTVYVVCSGPRSEGRPPHHAALIAMLHDSARQKQGSVLLAFVGLIEGLVENSRQCL